MKRSGLRESTFDGDAPDEPHAIAAHEDCIQIHFGEHGNEQVITLRPRHIGSIAAMHADWWESHWAPTHEAEA